MKIGFVYFHFWPNVGGTEMNMYDYGKALADLGHEVTVFTANALRFRPVHLPNVETRDGIAIRRFRFVPFPMKFAFISPSLVRALLMSNVNLIQVFSLLPSFFTLIAILTARLRGIPVVLYPQFYPRRFDHDRRPWVRIAGRIFDIGVAIHIVRLAQYTIAATRSEERFYRSQGVQTVRTIYQPVPRRDYPNAETLKEFRRRFGIEMKERIVLFVGRIERRKGLDVLVKALPSVLRKIRDTRVLVVGEDWGALKECLTLVDSSGCSDRLTVTGALGDQELSAAYALCDLVVIPSYFEAYGRTAVEAWAFGKPIVITDGVALSELVTPERGVVVKRGSPRALAEAIIQILGDRERARRLGVSGKIHMESTFLETGEGARVLVETYQDAIRVHRSRGSVALPPSMESSARKQVLKIKDATYGRPYALIRDIRSTQMDYCRQVLMHCFD